MRNNISSLVAALLVLVFFSGCVGQPKVPENENQSNSNALWAENKNVDADENDNVDVSDINKEVQSSNSTATPDVVNRMPFPVEEYSSLPRTGKGTIQGSIYLQDSYGMKIYGSRTRLFLNPVTSYSKQWYDESYVKGYKMTEEDSRLYNYLKLTSSDENGAFAFYGVPSGRYYLVGTVECQEKCGYGSNKKIRIATEVVIDGNEVVTQDLSKGI